MRDYIKKEDVEQIFTEWCHKEQISVMFCDVIMRRLQRLPSADVIEVSKILKTADEQEKQGFIQTAKVLRELVSND